MARIDWALLCDCAFLDRYDQLSIIGVIRHLPVPRVPLAVPRLMLVAHLAEVTPKDEIEVAIGLVTPSGRHGARPGSGQVLIDVQREYVLATFRDVAFV